MFYVMGRRHRYFAEVRDYDGEDGADAHLIAAAPEMLAALAAVRDGNTFAAMTQSDRDLVIAAIAKAEGQGA
jgi:hypothetical protein